jgi:hypothetical protein
MALAYSTRRGNPAKEQFMNICLLTDDEKNGINRKYTQNDLNDLSILASANETYTKTLLFYCLDTNNEMDRGVIADLLYILTWLAAPLNAFFYEGTSWLGASKPKPENAAAE